VSNSLSSPPAAETLVGDLVLVRMALPKKKPDAPKKMRDDLNKLLAAPLSATMYEELRESLTEAGYLEKGKRNAFSLTDSGRERALQFLGIAEFPRGTTWTKVIAKFLFPKACGLPPATAAKLDSGDKLSAFLLKQKYGLSHQAGSNVNQVLEALVCREVGFPAETTLEGLASAVLSQFLGTERLSKRELAVQLPLYKTGLTDTKADSIRRRLVRQWLSRESSEVGILEPGTLEPGILKTGSRGAGSQKAGTQEVSSQGTGPDLDDRFELDDFAATVKRLAADSQPHDRFHDNKVFISALWQASQAEPGFPRMPLEAFKQRLLESNREGLLHLSRADLVQAMDGGMVAASETCYLNATFHFVLLEDVSR
jgi:hypothetical protein